MKKLFGTSSKSKSKGINQNFSDEVTPPATPGLQTPIHSAHAVYQPPANPNWSGLQPLRPNSVLDPDNQSAEDLFYPSVTGSRTSSFASLQATLPPNPNNSPPTASPPLRKKPQNNNVLPGVPGILKALEPANSPPNPVYAADPPPSGRDTPMSIVMQSLSDEAPQHKDKSIKWNPFSRNNSHVEERRDGKDRREEREKHWQLVDRDEKREDRESGELTRMIGYLTATASEDWALVLEVCERASANEINAKDAVRALRREFKYGPPSSQLSAARLWAIMLRNSSEIFIAQCTSRKFLDTLEDLLINTGGDPFSSGKGTSPVVRERLLDVLAAAAYASGSRKDAGFRGLWKRVKPADKPDEGIPFDTDDAMFNPPIGGRTSFYETNPLAATPGNPTNPPPPVEREREREREHKKERSEKDKGRDRDREGRHKDREHRERDKDHREHRHKKSSRNRIIPLEEDIRRLFQECHIGMGNASLLTQALVHAKVEELKKGERGQVIKEFRLKCLSSQELIAAQIPWATAGAERSRKEKEREMMLLYGETDDKTVTQRSRDRTGSNNSLLADATGVPGNESPIDEQTTEEHLLAALLEANEELLGALGQFDDLERVAQERKAEQKSRKEIRMDKKAIATFEQQQQPDELGNGTGGSTVALSRSRSPSPVLSHHGSRPSSGIIQHSLPQHPQSLLPHPAAQLAVTQPPAPLTQQQHSPEVPSTTLAPPRAPPHGPRSPALHSAHSGQPHGHSRTGSLGISTSRTPSPSMESASWGVTVEHAHDRELLNGLSSLSVNQEKATWGRTSMDDDDSDHEILTPIKPSEKALGKRRVEVSDEPEPPSNTEDLYYDQTGSTDPYDPYAESDVYGPHVEGYSSDTDDSDSAYYPNGRPRSRNGILHHLHHPPVHFVYDAAAERTQQRLKEMESQMEKMQRERGVEVGNVH